MRLRYIGIDQYGDHYHITRHPRKELLEQLGRKHATMMYDDVLGRTKHTGYVIAGRWIAVHEVHEWNHK